MARGREVVAIGVGRVDGRELAGDGDSDQLVLQTSLREHLLVGQVGRVAEAELVVAAVVGRDGDLDVDVAARHVVGHDGTPGVRIVLGRPAQFPRSVEAVRTVVLPVVVRHEVTGLGQLQVAVPNGLAR